MNTYIYTSWVNHAGERLRKEQMKFLRSCLYFKYVPVFYTDIHIPEQRPKINELLKYANGNTDTEWIVFINSDCEIIRDISTVFNKDMCVAFHRTEIPSMKYCAGLDGFTFHKSLWKGFSKDMPDMYVGATHIDWWIARYFQKIGKLQCYKDFLYHVSHEKSGSALEDSDNEYSKHNVNNFMSWAKRNEIDYKTGWSTPEIRDIYCKT